MTKYTCSVIEDGVRCNTVVAARTMCHKHYARWRRHGDPLVTVPTVAQRFWIKVDKAGPIPSHAPELGPCWIWMAATAGMGYGVFRFRGRQDYAHRAVYEMVVAPIPAGLEIDHLCCVKLCVNPAHLEAVTCSENILRMIPTRKRRPQLSHCQRGHELTPENSYYHKTGQRECRACRNWRSRARAL